MPDHALVDAAGSVSVLLRKCGRVVITLVAVATSLVAAADRREADAATPPNAALTEVKGREATISWGGPELIFRNNWDAPIRMHVRASNNAITVRLYSVALGRRVKTVTGSPFAFERPRTVRVNTYALPPGVTRLVQAAGPAGFSIKYDRTVYRYSQIRSHVQFRVKYEPEHAYVEVGAERGGGGPERGGA